MERKLLKNIAADWIACSDNFMTDAELIDYNEFGNSLRNRDLKRIEYYLKFGNECRKILRNKDVHENAISWGYPDVIVLDENGWIIDDYEFKEYELFEFQGDGKKVSMNWVEIGVSPNGTWSNGKSFQTGGAGGSSSLSIWGDRYSTRKEALNAVTNWMINHFENAITKKDSDNYNITFCKKMLVEIKEFYAKNNRRQLTLL